VLGATVSKNVGQRKSPDIPKRLEGKETAPSTYAGSYSKLNRKKCHEQFPKDDRKKITDLGEKERQ